MSVAEQLRAFRYATADAPVSAAAVASAPFSSSVGPELPWKAIRSVNVAAMKHEEPDLKLMKNIVAMLSGFTITTSTVHRASDMDLLQLLQLMQASLQFTLHSQHVLKEQLVARQNMEAVQHVSSKYMERMDAKLSVLTHDCKALTEERDTLKLSVEALRHSLARQEATARTLENQLAQERLLHLSAPAGALAAPAPPPLAWSGSGPCPTCGCLPPFADPTATSENRTCASTRKKARRRRTSGGTHRTSRPSQQHRHDSLTAASEDDAISVTSSEDLCCRNVVRELSVRLAGGRSGSRQRQRSPVGAGDYVDWRTFTQFVAGLQPPLRQPQPKQPQPQQQRPVSARDFDHGSEHSIPVDAARRHSTNDFALSTHHSPVVPQPARVLAAHGGEDVGALLAGAVEVLKDDIHQQMSSMAARMESTTARLSSELALLRGSHQQLEARYTSQAQPNPRPAVAPSVTAPSQQQQQQQQQQVQLKPSGSGSSFSLCSAAAASPLLPIGNAPATCSSPQPQPQSQQPLRQRGSTPPRASSLLKLQRLAAIQTSPPPELPRPPPVQESVTPLTQSLPRTPAGRGFALAEPIRPVATAAAASTANEAPPPPANKAAAPVASQRTPAPAAAAGVALGGKGMADAASTTNAMLTTGLSPEHRDWQSPPSLQTSSLSVKSRSTIPEFDVSLLRTPPKGGQRQPGSSDRPAPATATAVAAVAGPSAVKSASAAAAAKRSTPSAGTASVKLASGSAGHPSPLAKPWYDTPSEDQPASASARAALGSAASSASGPLPFHPAGTPSNAPITTDALSVGQQQAPARCEHCSQKFPAAELAAHQRECSMQLIPCQSCGKRVVSRLMSRHECGSAATGRPPGSAGSIIGNENNNHNSNAPKVGNVGSVRASEGRDSLEHSRASSATGGNGSGGGLGPKRASSLLLMETQRELQSLLEEEEAYQRGQQQKQQS